MRALGPTRETLARDTPAQLGLVGGMHNQHLLANCNDADPGSKKKSLLFAGNVGGEGARRRPSLRSRGRFWQHLQYSHEAMPIFWGGR